MRKLPNRQPLERNLLGVIPGHPILVICGVILVALLALSRIVDLQTGKPRVAVDSSTDSLLPAGSDDVAFFERFKETFESGEVIFLALEDDDIFTAENLGRIQRISEAVEMLPEVDRVSSLSLSVNIRSESGALVVEEFYDDIPESSEDLADLRQRALSDPIYAGNLISRDGRIAVVIAHLFDISDLALQESGIDQAVHEILEREWRHAPFRMTGTAHVKTWLNDVLIGDMTVIIPITWVLMTLVTYITFRSIRSVVITLLSIQIAVLVTVGFIAFQFETLNQVTSAVPSILFVVGLAYAIHFLSAYYDAVRDLQASGDVETSPTVVALDSVFVPIVFTGFTTAAGFFSLATSPLEAIQQYGVATGMGALITMVVTLTFTPAVLQLLPIPKQPRERAGNERFSGWLIRLADFDIRNRRAILIAGFLVAVFSFAGLFRIQIGYDFVSLFKKHHPVRVDFEAINSSLEGANGFNVVLETSVTEGFKDPENLAVLDSLQAWLRDQPEIGGTTSFADYLKALYRGVEGGDPAYFRIPDSASLVGQLLVIGETEEIDQFVDLEFQIANINVRTTAMNSREVLPLVDRIEARLQDIPMHIQARVTGDSVLVSKTMDDIALGQATSMLSAFVSIFFILSLLFTSFKTGILALIPNALPVLFYFGILGWAGIELNVTTAMIACLVLGIAVDDTIHLLTHFNRGSKERADEHWGVTHALLSVGRPVTTTTIALCLGFVCLMFSDMRTQFEFGWLAAVTLGAAWAVDMTFTPALSAHLRIVTIWDVITLDLGEEPQFSVPLFKGLSANQAKVAASMATIAEFPAGTRIFKANEPGDHLYVVIDGRLEVSMRSDGEVVSLNEQERGAVLGEIALFNGVRSANVDTLTDVRLLRLDLEDLQRIQRRRPRIGAQLLSNLSRMQAQRIVDLTNRVVEARYAASGK